MSGAHVKITSHANKQENARKKNQYNRNTNGRNNRIVKDLKRTGIKHAIIFIDIKRHENNMYKVTRYKNPNKFQRLKTIVSEIKNTLQYGIKNHLKLKKKISKT